MKTKSFTLTEKLYNIYKFAIILSIFMMLSSCSNNARYAMSEDAAPLYKIDVSNVQNAVPKAEPKSMFGNPDSYVVNGRRYYVLKSSRGYHERGIASWYGMKFNGYRTSNGERYNLLEMTAAHKTLPLPTYVRVTNLENGKHVIVKINDRGPFEKDRLIDLSYAAANKLGITSNGTGFVDVIAIDPNRYYGKHHAPPMPTKIKHPRIYLQTGAYTNYKNAKAMQRRISGKIKTPACKIYKNYSNKKLIYKVQIGPVYNVTSADAITNRLSDAGISKPITIIKGFVA